MQWTQCLHRILIRETRDVKAREREDDTVQLALKTEEGTLGQGMHHLDKALLLLKRGSEARSAFAKFRMVYFTCAIL